MNEFIIGLAESTIRAFNGGDQALSAKQIAQWYYEKPLIGQDAIKEVARYLKQIIQIMEKDVERSFHPVSDYFFNRGNQPINDMEEAKKCLPWGGGIKYAGIRIVPDNSDILFRTWCELCGSSGAGAMRKTFDRVVLANNRGNISDNGALEIVDKLRRRTIPESLIALEERGRKRLINK